MSTRGYPRPDHRVRQTNPAAAVSVFLAVVAVAIVLVISLR
jgi:hypothetical protein